MFIPNVDVQLYFFAYRLKGYHFQEAGLSFQLSKQLAMSDISVRILHTRYDHLSHLSLRIQAQNKSPATKEEEEEEPEEAAEGDAEMLSETPKLLEDGETKEEDERGESEQQAKDNVSLKSLEEKKVRHESESGGHTSSRGRY